LKVNLRKSSKNLWPRIISLAIAALIAGNSYAALKPAVRNILDTKNGTELFNALTQKDEYLPSIIELSREQKISDNKRWNLIMAMTKLGGESVIPDLVGLRAANSWYIRSAVAKSLGMIRTEES
jgi:hypothetical protein